MTEARSGPDTGRDFDKDALLDEILAALGLLNLSLRYGGTEDFTREEFEEMFDTFMTDTSKRALYSVLMTSFTHIQGGPYLLSWLSTSYQAEPFNA